MHILTALHTRQKVNEPSEINELSHQYICIISLSLILLFFIFFFIFMAFATFHDALSAQLSGHFYTGTLCTLDHVNMLFMSNAAL